MAGNLQTLQLLKKCCNHVVSGFALFYEDGAFCTCYMYLEREGQKNPKPGPFHPFEVQHVPQSPAEILQSSHSGSCLEYVIVFIDPAC